jgi:pilus assembly protein Flp/PilA
VTHGWSLRGNDAEVIRRRHLAGPGKSQPGGFVSMIRSLALRIRDQKGQGMVEYALILVLIAVVVIVILGTLGHQVGNTFSTVSSAL